MAAVQLLITGSDQSQAAFSSAQGSIKSLGDQSSSASGKVSSAFSGIGTKIKNLAMEFYFVKAAVESVFSGIKSTVDEITSVVDNFATTVIQNAALITSFQGGDNVADNYRAAKEYASALQEKLLEINSSVFMNQQELSTVSTEMIKQGVILDINNDKQVKAFGNIANAVAVIAAGSGNREIQIHQEVRALMEGEVNAQSMLAQQIDSMVGGGLKQKIAMWKEEGTLIEHIGELLTGYAAATGDISSLWTAIKTTTESLLNKIFREGFAPIYKDMAAALVSINKYLAEHGDTISSKIKSGWELVKSVVSTVVDYVSSFYSEISENATASEALHQIWMVIKAVVLGVWEGIKALKEPMQVLIAASGFILSNFGRLVYDVFPPLMQRIGAFTQAIWENVKMIGNLVMMTSNAIMGNFSAAAGYWRAAKDNFVQGGVKTAEAFRTGFVDEIAKRDDEWMSKVDVTAISSKMNKKVDIPEINKPPTDEMKKNVKSVADAYAGAAKSVTEFGKAEMSLADAKYSEDLKRQAEILKEFGRTFTDIQQPVKNYLAVIDDVEKKQKAMLKDTAAAISTLQGTKIDPKTGKTYFGEETKKALAQLKLDELNIEKAAATQRLKVWDDYYKNLKSVITDKEKEIDDANKALIENRIKTQQALLQVNTKPLDDSYKDNYTKYQETIAGMKAQISKALTSGDSEQATKTILNIQAQAAAMQDFKGVLVDMQKTVRDYEGTGIFNQKVVDKIVSYQDEVVSADQKTTDLTDVVKTAGDALEILGNNKIDSLNKEMDAMKVAGGQAEAAIKTLNETLKTLDEQITKQSRMITLSLDDKVTAGLKGMKAELENLTNKTYTVKVQYADSYASVMTPSYSSNNSRAGGDSSGGNAWDYYQVGDSFYWGDGTYGGPAFEKGGRAAETGLALIHKNEEIIPSGKASSGQGDTTINIPGGVTVILQSTGQATSDADAVGRGMVRGIKRELSRSL